MRHSLSFLSLSLAAAIAMGPANAANLSEIH